MKLGAGTFTWAVDGQDLVTALREIADLKIQFVDVAAVMHGHPQELSDDEKRQAGVVLSDLGLIGSSLVAVEGWANVAAEDEAERQRVWEYFQAALEFAHMLDVKQLLCKGGDRMIDVPNAKAWDNAVLFLQQLAGTSRSDGVFLTLELEWRTCGLVQSIEQMERMLANVDRENVLANIDLGHVALARDGVEDLRRIAARTVHLHVNDNNTFVHTNSVPGTGDVPLASFVGALAQGAEEKARKTGQILVAGIEAERSPGSKEAPSEIVRRSRDWVLANIPEIEV